MNARENGKTGMLVAAGLAFSLGWVWFPWLAALWLPHATWGGIGTGGGGTAFLLLLILGFPSGGALAGRLVAGAEEGRPAATLLRRHARHLCHGVAFLLLLLSLLFSLRGSVILPGKWQYLIVPAVATAYLLTGLYWGCRLLEAPGTAAPAVFCGAVLSAAVMGWALSLLPMRGQLIAWPLGILIAWLLSEALNRAEAPPAHRKRPTRHIPECGSRQPNLPACRISCITWIGLAVLFAAVGFTGGLLPGMPAVSPSWLSGVPFGLGAAVPAAVVWRGVDRPERGLLVSAALCVPLAALLSFCLPAAGNALLMAAEGFLSGLGLALQAGSADRKQALRRVGAALGACVLALNGGYWLGGLLITEATLAATVLPALAGGLILLAPLSASFLRDRRERAQSRNEEKHEDTPGIQSGQADTPPASALSFTVEEQKLIALLAMPDLSNQDIADQLFISRDTVRYHLKKLYAKTNTSSRSELLHAAASRLDVSRRHQAPESAPLRFRPDLPE